MFCQKKFKNIKEATTELLTDSVKIANLSGLNYLVIGGWCPFLRNSHRTIQHEGTRDVDLLFFGADVKGTLKKVVSDFLNNGYLLSAKHDFQLFRKYRVTDHELVFNVDLLHPLEGEVGESLFSDHFDLGICFDDDDEEFKKMKSIALPSSKFIFDEKLYSNFFLNDINIPLIDDAGLIFSKSKSVMNEKRQRDSFDIYLTLCQPEVERTIQTIKRCCDKNYELRRSIETLIEYVNSKSDIFNKNVTTYCKIIDGNNPSDHVTSQLKKTLSSSSSTSPV